jgi:hypothetical protein
MTKQYFVKRLNKGTKDDEEVANFIKIMVGIEVSSL